MIGTITWHFKNCVIIGSDQDTCEHAMVKEYENLDVLLKDIESLQHRPFVTPDYILVEYHGNLFNVTTLNDMVEFHQFLATETLKRTRDFLEREANGYRISNLDSSNS